MQMNQLFLPSCCKPLCLLEVSGRRLPTSVKGSPKLGTMPALTVDLVFDWSRFELCRRHRQIQSSEDTKPKFYCYKYWSVDHRSAYSLYDLLSSRLCLSQTPWESGRGYPPVRVRLHFDVSAVCWGQLTASSLKNFGPSRYLSETPVKLSPLLLLSYFSTCFPMFQMGLKVRGS